MTLEQKYERLQQLLATFPDVLVAYSGGVDSTFLLKVAVDVLGERALGFIGRSPSLPTAEFEAALAVARQFQLPVVVIETHELDDRRYKANPDNRCYFCKKELFGEMMTYARQHGFRCIADGTNADDVGDYRPGRQAAAEFQIRSPLLEVGLHKTEIRELSRRLGLPTWNKPEMACLASRFPTGTEITLEKLRQVEAAEAVLRELGFRQLRVRHHGDLARIELDADEIHRLFDPRLRQQVHQQLRQLGYRYITLDLQGYRRGSVARVEWKQASYED
ncbi:MAG: ATP-dependent sacrificial sulfur transferase LarE [Calditrichaeota bacterium]|nr:ATP-dependent sacrificial sulfur transferase LarE [Calditrichota bacterium]